MEIDSRTTIPIFAALGGLPFVIGGILWLTSIDSRASEANKKAFEMSTTVRDIHERVIRIEEHMKAMDRRR